MSEEKKQLINRLKRIEGHVKGITKMVEEGQDEADVLIQMLAIQSAVKKACAILIEDKIKRSLADSVDRRVQEQSDVCCQCSKFPNLREAIEQLDYDEIVDFVLRFTK